MMIGVPSRSIAEVVSASHLSKDHYQGVAEHAAGGTRGRAEGTIHFPAEPNREREQPIHKNRQPSQALHAERQDRMLAPQMAEFRRADK